MKKPEKTKRNTISFELELKAGKLDMSELQEELIKEHVFSNYAYRRRQKILTRKAGVVPANVQWSKYETKYYVLVFR